MSLGSTNTELLMRYLLGELSDTEQGELEQQYFKDPALFNELRVLRDDLIDAYVRNELPSDLRQRFERSFNALPERHERVAFADALREAVESRKSQPVHELEAIGKQRRREGSRSRFLSGLLSAVPRPVYAFATLLVLGFASWAGLALLRDWQRGASSPPAANTPERVATVPSPTTQAESSPQPAGSAQPLPTTAPPSVTRTGSLIASFVLDSDLVRSSRETQPVLIPKDATAIQLKLILESAEYKNYRAEIRTPEGTSTWTSGRLQAQSDRTGSFVTLLLPTTVLKNADYIVRLIGVTTANERVSAGRYYFRATIR